jgi:glutamyl-tRNA synthetase
VSIRVRFAPSPTGYLHIGNARTAVFNYLFARQQGGTFVLRIEDTDENRSTPESTEQILASLRWMGLDWDEGPEVGGPYEPYQQTARRDMHMDFAKRLFEAGDAFYCTCPATKAEGEEPDYSAGPTRGPKLDLACRNRTVAEQRGILAETPALPLKVKCPEKTVVISDLIRGPIKFDLADIGDFVILKSSGSPVYNFSVVVDDITMKITHVIRGEDHISNTPKQLLLYELFGAKPPEFAHVPLIMGEDRARLSKRHGATSVWSYKEAGVLPEALVNFLLLVGWAPKDNKELFTRDEMVSYFRLSDVGKSSGVFNIEKLHWINGKYIRALSDDEYFDALREFVPVRWKSSFPENYTRKAALLLKDRLSFLSEFEDLASYFFEPPAVKPDAEKEVILDHPERIGLLEDLFARLESLAEFDHQSLEQTIRAYVAETGCKLGDVAQPLRVILTGDRFSPGIFEVTALLGKEETTKRFSAWLARHSG